MDSTVANLSASTIASDAARIRALLRERKFSEALAEGEALLADTADNRDVLLNKNALGDALEHYRDE
jgi:hypothetical protein